MLVFKIPCPCCGQPYSEQQRQKVSVHVELFREPYVVCPGCLQTTEAGTIRQDPEFRRKARVEMYHRYGLVVRVSWSPTYEEPPVEMDEEPEKRRRRHRQET